MPLRAYKFTIPANEWRPLPDDSASFSGCVAVVIAANIAAAREAIFVDALRSVPPFDARWINVADVIDFPVDEPRLLTLAMI